MIRIFTISLLLALCACTDQQTELGDASRALRFGVESIEDTKGSIINTSNITSMSVFCAHTGKEQYSSTATCNWMHNAKVTRENENSEWTVQEGGNKQWAGEGYHSFFAFAPHAPVGADISASDKQGPPTLTYTVPVDYTKQVDLLYSHTTLINGKQMYIGSRPVSFGFRHALSKITFEARKETEDLNTHFFIDKISLNNILSEGILKFNLDDQSKQIIDADWFNKSNPLSFLLSYNNGLQNKWLTNQMELISEEGSDLFILPQDINEESKIVIDYKISIDNTITEKTLELKLCDLLSKFEFGKAYRFSIVLKEEKVTVTAKILDWVDETVNVAVPGTFLNVSSSNITAAYGSEIRIFYSTDGSPVDLTCQISVTHNLVNKSITLDNTTPVGEHILILKADKLRQTIRVKIIPPYVQIGDLLWAIGNLVADGPNKCKIGQPQDGGLYFQRWSLIGWTGGANGDGTGQPSNGPNLAIQVKPEVYGGSSWNPDWVGSITLNEKDGKGDPCEYYLGNGWRLPKLNEWGVSGRFPMSERPANCMTGKYMYESEDKQNPRIWFENAGRRKHDNGILEYDTNEKDWVAYYWTIVERGLNAWSMTSAAMNRVELGKSYGTPIRCVKPIGTEDPDFIVEEGVAAPRIFVQGTGDNAKLMLTKKPTNYGAYFQFMGITAWEYDNSIKYQPYIVTTDGFWTSSSAHNITSLKAGQGDPCRLVGYTQKQVQDLVDAGIVPDNGKWKTPVHTPGSDSEINQPKPDGWVIISGVKGHYYTVNTLVEFLPAAGFSWCGGNLINKNSTGAYWTSTVASHKNKGESLRLYENSLVGNFNQEHGARMSVRCVQQ